MAKKEIENRKEIADIFQESAMRIIKNKDFVIDAVIEAKEQRKHLKSEVESDDYEDENEDGVVGKKKYQTRNKKTWEEIKESMKNDHADRFNEILKNLPDREYVRVYLKVLEFVEPKIVRQIADTSGQADKTINIVYKDV